MKRFISIVCIYFFCFLLIILIPEEYKIITNAELEKDVPGEEVRAAVRSSKTKTNKKIRKLIIGDSTGHTLYPSEKTYDGVVSFACNQAITMAGHYFLLKNYLETNHENLPNEIIILFTPETFGNDVDMFAYQYFLKPFPILEYKSLYTKHLYDRIKTIPLYWTANLPFIQTSGYTPRIAVPANEERENLSELSAEYLLKIDSITKRYNVPYKMLSTPVRDDCKELTERRIEDLLRVCPEQLVQQMNAYTQSIPYYPSELFFDHVHLNDTETPKDYLGILQ